MLTSCKKLLTPSPCVRVSPVCVVRATLACDLRPPWSLWRWPSPTSANEEGDWRWLCSLHEWRSGGAGWDMVCTASHGKSTTKWAREPTVRTSGPLPSCGERATSTHLLGTQRRLDSSARSRVLFSRDTTCLGLRPPPDNLYLASKTRVCLI